MTPKYTICSLNRMEPVDYGQKSKKNAATDKWATIGGSLSLNEYILVLDINRNLLLSYRKLNLKILN